jgi:hypothetical protein
MIDRLLMYETQLIYSRFTFLVENETSVDCVRAGVRLMNSLDVPMHAENPLELRLARPAVTKRDAICTTTP